MNSAQTQKRITEDVIHGCAYGDRNCQRLIYETYVEQMFAICLRYCNDSDEAKDVLHEGFIKLFKKVQGFRAESSFEAWMSTLFRNHAIDYVRSAYKRYIRYVDEVTDPEDTPYVEDGPEFSTTEVMNALNALRPDQRAVINMYAIDGMSHAEIAGMLNIKESSSRSKLLRARQALKDILRNG